MDTTVTLNPAAAWPFPRKESDVQTQTEGTTGTQKGARGRKTKDKQEAVIKPGELKERMAHLVQLKKAADSASEDLNDAIKAVAEKSGLLATVVRKAVVASAGEDFEAKHREVEQLQLAFEAVA